MKQEDTVLGAVNILDMPEYIETDNDNDVDDDNIIRDDFNEPPDHEPEKTNKVTTRFRCRDCHKTFHTRFHKCARNTIKLQQKSSCRLENVPSHPSKGSVRVHRNSRDSENED